MIVVSVNANPRIRSNARLRICCPTAREIEREKHQQEQIECSQHRCSAIETRTIPRRRSTNSPSTRPRFRGPSSLPCPPPPPPCTSAQISLPRTGLRKSRSSCCTDRIYPQGSCRTALSSSSLRFLITGSHGFRFIHFCSSSPSPLPLPRSPILILLFSHLSQFSSSLPRSQNLPDSSSVQFSSVHRENFLLFF